MNTYRMHRELRPAVRRAIGIAFLVFLLILWQILSVLVGKSFLLPGPGAVFESLWENRSEIFLVHLPATMQVVAVGGILSIVIGFALAVFMDLDRRIERAVYPVLTFTQTIPVMCIAPVFVLWFGYSVTMRVVVVILVNFFTVAVNVFDGFQATQKNRSELLQTFGADRIQSFFLLRLPTAMPNFFTALKILIPWSVVGAAVSEWLGAPSGLGCYSRSCMMNLDAAGLLAPLVLLSAVALLLTAAVRAAEKRFFSRSGES